MKLLVSRNFKIELYVEHDSDGTEFYEIFELKLPLFLKKGNDRLKNNTPADKYNPTYYYIYSELSSRSSSLFSKPQAPFYTLCNLPFNYLYYFN